MYKLLLMVLLCLGLQGCIAGAFVAGGATAGGVISEPRSFNSLKTDQDMSFKINKKFSDDPALSTISHVSATSYNQVVLLIGQAPTLELRDSAEEKAREVPHIKRLFNQITVALPSSTFNKSKDTFITSRVKTRMLATKNLKSNQFKIVTEEGTVYILGLATHRQADLAAAVAQETDGVKKVVKLVEYVQD